MSEFIFTHGIKTPQVDLCMSLNCLKGWLILEEEKVLNNEMEGVSGIST